MSDLQLENMIDKAITEDLNTIKIYDSGKYMELIKEYTPILVQAILQINVKSLRYTKEFVPEYTVQDIESKKVTVIEKYTDSSGKEIITRKEITVETPITRIVPAHYRTIANAGAEAILIDTKTNKPIWTLQDIRDAEGSKVPVEMLERILKRASDRFDDVVIK